MQVKIDILDSIKKTLNTEANAIINLISTIDENWILAIELIQKCKGKIIVTGVGKSALIGQKIVATLNSTASKSIFLHASDALHGDLGVIHDEDIVICISKSGETEEIKQLLPHLKNIGVKIISMVSNNNSYLSINSDCSLYLPIEKEADPNNLAPTASTTLQLASGDALAVALMEIKSFTPSHFALLHPGGNLGKSLTMKVKDISSKNQKPFVSPNQKINEIIISISSARLGATVVIEDSRIIGIITDGDLRRMLQNHNFTHDITAKEIMSNNPKIIESNQLAIEAFNIMRNNSITQLIVVNERRYDGIIHMHDLLKEGFL